MKKECHRERVYAKRATRSDGQKDVVLRYCVQCPRRTADSEARRCSIVLPAIHGDVAGNVFVDEKHVACHGDDRRHPLQYMFGHSIARQGCVNKLIQITCALCGTSRWSRWRNHRRSSFRSSPPTMSFEHRLGPKKKRVMVRVLGSSK